MERIAGMRMTGRRVSGPSADLVELEDDSGVIHTAIVFADRYRNHEHLGRAIELARSFMEFPMVPGLAEMVAYLPEDGAVVYRTGRTRSLAEVLTAYREDEKRVSRLAAVQLCYLAAQVLDEAAENGAAQGVYSHGDVSPWRVLVKPSGEVMLIGYGVPCPELWESLHGDGLPPKPGCVRYSPPERLQGGDEDVGSDLVSLCLVILELMMGEPLIDGPADQVKTELLNDQITHKLAKLGKALSKPLVDALLPAVDFDPAGRYGAAMDFVRLLGALLERAKGGSGLDAAVAPAFARTRGRSLSAAAVAPTPTPTPTPAGSPVRSSARATEPPATPTSMGRWGSVSRDVEPPGDAEAPDRAALRARLRASTEAAMPPSRAGTAKEALRERLRASLDASAPPSDTAATTAKDALKARLRASRDAGPPAEPSPGAEPSSPKEALRARLKASRDHADAPTVAPEPPNAPAAAPAAEEPAPRRRRASTEASPAAPAPAPATDPAPRRRRRVTEEPPPVEAAPGAPPAEPDPAPRRRRRKVK